MNNTLIGETLLDSYADYFFSSISSSWNFNKYIFYTIIIICIIMFIIDEFKLIKRKVKDIYFTKPLLIENIKKNYNFKQFLDYNMGMLYVILIYIFAMCMFIYLIEFLIFILLGVLILIYNIIYNLTWWLLIPVILFGLKYLLYKLSERYK